MIETEHKYTNALATRQSSKWYTVQDYQCTKVDLSSTCPITPKTYKEVIPLKEHWQKINPIYFVIDSMGQYKGDREYRYFFFNRAKWVSFTNTNLLFKLNRRIPISGSWDLAPLNALAQWFTLFFFFFQFQGFFPRSKCRWEYVGTIVLQKRDGMIQI